MGNGDTQPVLVLGATGSQGAAVAQSLLARNIPVRGVARSDRSAAMLEAAGIIPVAGDFTDATAMTRACEGVRAVFSMQEAAFLDPDSERRQCATIVSAARKAGVRQIIHTSVSGAGAFHRSMKDWGTGRWTENYWESKADCEDMVRGAGFALWTILKPALLMENFIPPKMEVFFPHLSQGEIVSALDPETKMALVTAEDVGAATVAAVEDPERFNGQSIELGGDALTMSEVAAVLSRASGRPISARSVSPAEAERLGIMPSWITSQIWANEVGYPAKPEDSRRLGLSPTTMEAWANRHFTA
jgi:uncharacterized protein YbjT (DUF2867 family)